MQKFYLTTAIPYVNAAPHLGHIMEFIQSDAIARYQKLHSKEVALVTGADENSLKNVQAAEKKGISAQKLCDENSEAFREIAKKTKLSFTTFRRTSDKKLHWIGVQRLWELCDKKGDIYTKKYRGLYCVGCEAFYEPEELTEGICPEHKKAPEVVEEENYFFKLSNYQDKLEKLIESNELRIIPESRKNEVLSFIKSGLKDFSISRSVERARGWGVPVPNDSKQIQYVWFDALGTYITGVGYGTDEKEFEKYWPAQVHVIGKGILRFHAVYWIAMLLSAGLKLPKAIFVHGYITVEGQKMSKSLGNIIDPNLLIEKYGLEPIRYMLLGEIPTFEDGDFSEKVLMESNNNELLANLGNLVNRTLVFVKNNFESKIPCGELNEEDKKFLNNQKTLVLEIEREWENYKIKEALHKTMAFSKNANRYFQDNKPWELVKKDRIRAEAAIGVLVNQVKDLAILVEPYLPGTSSEIFKQLNIEPRNWNDLGKIISNHTIGNPSPLFKKIEIEVKKVEEVQKPKFSDLDLEVGEIISVERHPNAEKLYVEKIKLSDGIRQIVSGLVDYYKEEELLGKKVVVLRNLKSAPLRRVESQGMVLAAENKEGVVEVLTSSEAVGSKVSKKDEKSAPKQLIDYKEFSKIKIEVKEHLIYSDGNVLVVNNKEIRTIRVKEGDVS